MLFYGIYHINLHKGYGIQCSNNIWYTFHLKEEILLGRNILSDTIETIRNEKFFSSYYNYYLGIFSMKYKRFDKAIMYLKKSSEGKLTRSESNYHLSLVYYYKGNYVKSKELLDPLIQQNPNNGKYHFLSGEIYLKNKNIKDAQNKYKEALDLGYSPEKVFYKLGYCSQELNDFNKALQYYEKSLRLNQNNPTVLNNMGLCYLKLGQLNKSLECLKIASKISPKDKILRNLGLTLARKIL